MIGYWLFLLLAQPQQKRQKTTITNITFPANLWNILCHKQNIQDKIYDIHKNNAIIL